MKTKAEEILASKQKNTNNDVCSRRESFCRRWNIIDDNKDYNKIKIRSLTAISKILNSANKPSEFEFVLSKNDDFLGEYCSELSMILGFDDKPNGFDTFEHKELYKNLSKLDLNHNDDYKLFLWFLEETLNYNFENYGVKVIW